MYTAIADGNSVRDRYSHYNRVLRSRSSAFFMYGLMLNLPIPRCRVSSNRFNLAYSSKVFSLVSRPISYIDEKWTVPPRDRATPRGFPKMLKSILGCISTSITSNNTYKYICCEMSMS